MEDDVFGGDAGGELAFDVDAEGFGLVLRQGLGGHHVLDFAGADAEGQRAEGPVGGGVRVAADDGHAGLGGAELGADHVDDALRGVLDVEELDAELGAVSAERVDLRDGDLVRDVEAVLRREVVGTLWSTVAMWRSGRRSLRPARRRPSKACGEVTSWTSWRSM